MTAYIAPSLIADHVYNKTAASFFDAHAIGFFILSGFAGMAVGSVLFGFIADRFGRRSSFMWAMLWYAFASLMMAFQTQAVAVNLWRFIASMGLGLELRGRQHHGQRACLEPLSGQSRGVLSVHLIVGRPFGGLYIPEADPLAGTRSRRLAVGCNRRQPVRPPRLVVSPSPARESAVARCGRQGYRGRSRDARFGAKNSIAGHKAARTSVRRRDTDRSRVVC